MFENLLKPGNIGKITIKNRMKCGSMTTGFCDHDTGEVTDREIGFLAERARGGAGMVTTGAGYIDLLGKFPVGQMAVDKDNLVPGLTRLANAIQENGAKAVAQIIHAGRYAQPQKHGLSGQLPLGPTAMKAKIPRFGSCREITVEEIRELVEMHGQAARRVKEAGFDAVELCAIAGYIIPSFLCRWTNRRSDEYGGGLENRARLLLEIIECMRKEVGPDYPIFTRLNGTDLLKDGNPDEEYIEIARMCETAGIDFISITVGWHEGDWSSVTTDIPPGHWLGLAEKWKLAGIQVPLGMAYRLNRPEIAEKAVADGIIDYWEMARPLIIDPYLPLKLAEGRPEDIAICPACNTGCFSRVFIFRSISCTVNPKVGHEDDAAYDIRPAEKKKSVMVVGGGPAGMEAARVAALRGHDVTLYERRSEIGGQVRLGAKTPMLPEWDDLVNYYSVQLGKGGVKTEPGKEVDVGLIRNEKPDVLILATGARPVVPDIPGAEEATIVDFFDVLEGRVEAGKRVLVLGGGRNAVNIAEWLATRGKDVTLISRRKKIGKAIEPFNLMSHRRKLAELGVKQLTDVQVNRITSRTIDFSKEGKEETIEGDTVVFAMGMVADNKILGDLGAHADVEEVYSIGDCVAPRNLFNAIHEGFRIGMAI